MVRSSGSDNQIRIGSILKSECMCHSSYGPSFKAWNTEKHNSVSYFWKFSTICILRTYFIFVSSSKVVWLSLKFSDVKFDNQCHFAILTHRKRPLWMYSRKILTDKVACHFSHQNICMSYKTAGYRSNGAEVPTWLICVPVRFLLVYFISSSHFFWTCSTRRLGASTEHINLLVNVCKRQFNIFCNILNVLITKCIIYNKIRYHYSTLLSACL